MIANHEVHIMKASCSAVKTGNRTDSRDDSDWRTVTEMSDTEHSRTIFIEDVPSHLVEFLELHLESEKKGGGAVEKLICRNGGTLVTFERSQGLMFCRTANEI